MSEEEKGQEVRVDLGPFGCFFVVITMACAFLWCVWQYGYWTTKVRILEEQVEILRKIK